MSEASAAAPAATTEAGAPAASPAPAAGLSAVSTMLGGDTPAAPEVPGAGEGAQTPESRAGAGSDGGAEVALTMPGKDATPEQWAEFYAKIGRPETPEAYELPLPEGDDGAFAKEMAPILHKHGITADQAKGLANDWNVMVSAQQQQAQAAEAAAAQAAHIQNTAEAAELKTAWGQQFDANMHHAKQAVQQFLPKDKAAEMISALESKLGYKATIEFLHNIGKGLGEHDAAGMGANNAGTSGKSIADRLYGGSSQ